MNPSTLFDKEPEKSKREFAFPRIENVNSLLMSIM